MDPIKEAFSKIKDDIKTLSEAMLELRGEINSINAKVTSMQESIPTHIQTTPTHNPTQEPIQTDKQTHIQTTPTHKQAVQSPYTPNIDSSIGNGGAPTDKQTNQQTNQQTDKSAHNPAITQAAVIPRDYPSAPTSDFKKASEILESLDSVKRAIRLKFKRLTPQEMLVFSTLYSLEEQKINQITYKLLANNLNLSESSIRDYTNKLIAKFEDEIKRVVGAEKIEKVDEGNFDATVKSDGEEFSYKIIV